MPTAKEPRTAAVLDSLRKTRAQAGMHEELGRMRGRFDDYMHELIGEILHHNNVAYVDPLRIEMYGGLRERTRRGILEWLMERHYVSSAAVDFDVLKARCLPRLTAVMRGDGLHIFDPSRREAALVPNLVYRSDWLLNTGRIEQARRKKWRLEAHLNPSDISQVWINVDGLQRLELCSNDPDLKQLCLLDWLTICSDNRLAGYLAKVNDTRRSVNQAASTKAVVRAGDARLREEVKRLGKKPTKTELRSRRNINTVIEAAAMSGLPRPMPAAVEAGLPMDPLITAPTLIPMADPVDDLLELAAALYDSQR